MWVIEDTYTMCGEDMELDHDSQVDWCMASTAPIVAFFRTRRLAATANTSTTQHLTRRIEALGRRASAEETD